MQTYLVAVYYVGQAIGALPKASRSGYTFNGWWTSKAGGTQYTSETILTGDVILFAHWLAKVTTYTVSYDANGGSGAPSSDTYTYGTDYTLSSTKPTRTGYTFSGWTLNGTSGTVYSAGATISGTLYAGNHTWYAKWSLNYRDLEIHFKQQCATNTTTLNVSYSTNNSTFSDTGKTISSPPNETSSTSSTYMVNFWQYYYAAGYYYYKVSIVNTSYNYEITATTSGSRCSIYSSDKNSITVRWDAVAYGYCYITVKQKYTISYQNGSATGGDVPESQEKIYGTDITLQTNSFTKDGYEANGWIKSDRYLETPDYASSGTYSENADMILYPNFLATYFSANRLKYDTTDKYFYLEDGYMPQTYADMIASGLNTSVTNYGTKIGEFSLENGTTYKLASYDDNYYLGFTATKDMTLDLVSYETSGTYSFAQGTLYWFRFEPIRWRITGNGTDDDLEEWYNYGDYHENFLVVSDLVLWYDCMDTNENHKECDKAYDLTFTTSLRDGNFETMLSTFTNSCSNGKLQFSGSSSAEWQKFGETGQTNPTQIDTTHTTSDYELTNVNKYTSGSASSLRVASTDEICDTVGNTKAKASCLVAFLMASSNNQYSKYWTRDLGISLNAGKVVAKNGLTRSEWLTNSNGIRFAYTMSEGSRGTL